MTKFDVGSQLERDQAEIPADLSNPITGRDLVVRSAARQWLGPTGGPEEIITRNPVYAYLVGTLFPAESEGVAGGSGISPSLDGAVSLESEQIDIPEEPDVVSEGESSANELEIQGWAPKGLGLSILHSDARIQVSLSFGVYELLAKVAGESEEWKRTPFQETHFIDTRVSGEVSVGAGRGKLSWNSRSYDDNYLTTFSISNQQCVDKGEVKRHPNKCLFQVDMKCATDGMLLPYPQQVFSHDPEDKELAFRYRGKPLFAVGHGTAVEWERGAENPSWVRSTAMPLSEVKSSRARGGSGSAYEMGWLAEGHASQDALCDSLEEIVSGYSAWTDGQDLEVAGAKGDDREIAARLIERQRRASARISEGIQLLRTSSQAYLSFCLANEAMRLQMLRQRGGIPESSSRSEQTPQGTGSEEPRWHPFQLAFILASLPSTLDSDHADRELVDLIWFPTGGGKTEAYLGLAAIEMIRRRLQHGQRGGGLAVLTRYTMRLLTAQQFQRAATLICALEIIRNERAELRNSAPFTIGLWLGNDTTPATFQRAVALMKDARGQANPENPFQLLECPWCNTAIFPAKRSSDPKKYGVRVNKHEFAFFCVNAKCTFSQEIPVQVVDEGIYLNPPTMLVGTVDKFARLAWIEEGAQLFGIGTLHDPPSLVIQDELHLLSGPLGTVVGIYEAAILGLLRWTGVSPKIVSSTATTRASARQVQELFGAQVATFPPSGLNADDNYFSEVDPDSVGRLYLGLMPQAHTPQWAVGQIATELLDAPVSNDLSDEAKDAYWTLVIYHNSLRDLGRTVTILRDDVTTALTRRKKRGGDAREIHFDGVQELNGNVGSSELVSLLNRLERKPDEPGCIDALATTNIMSVGIDVSRLGVMLMNGLTKTTAEYIQATSRVGRGSTPGLVVTMFRPSKPRDRSVFESFGAFHTSYYRYVEPSGVAPWSTQARKRALHAAFVILMRHGAGLKENQAAHRFEGQSLSVSKAKESISRHVRLADPREHPKIMSELGEIIRQWEGLVRKADDRGQKLEFQKRLSDISLLRDFAEDREGFATMNSMRSVDLVVKVRANGERNG